MAGPVTSLPGACAAEWNTMTTGAEGAGNGSSGNESTGRSGRGGARKGGAKKGGARKGGADQAQMSVMQGAHGRNHGDACPFAAPPRHHRAKLTHRADDRDAHSARTFDAAG